MFDRSFSRPRLAPYLDAAQLDGTQAVDHYQWNLQVSEAFYPALSVLGIFAAPGHTVVSVALVPVSAAALTA